MPHNTIDVEDPPSPIATEPPSDDVDPAPRLHRDNTSLRFEWLERKPGCYINGSVPEVSLKYFVQHLLPPLPDDLSVRYVAEKLNLGQVNNALAVEDGVAVWDRFLALGAAVGEAGREVLKEKDVELESSVVFVENKAARMEWQSSDDRHYGIQESKDNACYMAHPRKPSSYAVLKDKYYVHRRRALDWQDIAIPGVMVHSDRDQGIELKEAYARIVTTMFEMMRETPHRRFIYGYSVDYKAESMRLWYLSRSELLVSKQFNFVNDKLPALVHFFLSVQFASLAQLGYDPTMKLFKSRVSKAINRGKDHYDMSVHWKDEAGQRKEKVFRTVELLSDVGAKTTLSSGTREWVGLELDAEGQPCGEPVTIRDYWVPEGQRREGDTLSDIREAATNSGNAEHVENVENFLAHVVCHGDVCVENKRDSTISLPEESGVLVLATEEGSKAHCSMKLDLATTGRQILTHYRIVYKHFGTPIDTISSMSKLLKLLPQALKGMSTIHALTYVHRGIRPSYISIVGPRAILTGFELAAPIGNHLLKKEYQPADGDQFAATEVYRQCYLFLPEQAETDSATAPSPTTTRSLTPKPPPMRFSFPTWYLNDPSKRDTFDGLDDQCSEPQVTPAPSLQPSVAPSQPPEPASPPFQFNTLHDYESLWWLCVYLLVHREVCESSLSTASMEALFLPGQQVSTAWAMVFGGQCTEMSHVDRQALLEDEERFNMLCERMSGGVKCASRALDRVRRRLVQQYNDAEKNVESINHTTGKELYGTYEEALQTASVRLGRLEARKRRKITFEPLNVVRVMTADRGEDTRPGPLDARIEMIRLNKPFAKLKWSPQEEEAEDQFVASFSVEGEFSPASSAESLGGHKRKRGGSYGSLLAPSQASSRAYWSTEEHDEDEPEEKRTRLDNEDDEEHAVSPTAIDPEFPALEPSPQVVNVLSLGTPISDVDDEEEEGGAPSPTAVDAASQAIEPIPEEVDVENTQTSNGDEGSIYGEMPLPSLTQGGRRTRRTRLERWGSSRSHSMGLRSSQN